MSLTTTKYSYPTNELLTRADIVKRYLLETGFGLTGTAEAGSSSTTIIAQRLKSGQYRAEDYEGGFVRISTTTDALAPQGEVRAIDSFIPEQGKLVTEPPFSAAVGAGDTYQIFRLVHPQDILDHIDNLVENLFFPAWAFLSEVPDGDMEQATTTGDWQATNATLSKTSAEPVMHGKRYLSVVSTGANGYASLINPISIEPQNQQYHCSAMVRAATSGTTARLTLYDETNGAVIQYKDVTRRQNVRLYLDNIHLPTNCYQVNIRLETVESGKTTEWDDVVFYAVGAQRISLPWWISDQSQLKAIFRYAPKSLDTNVYLADYEGRRTQAWNYQDDAFGRGMHHITSNIESVANPLYIYATRPETAFASDTDVIHADADHMHANLMARVFASMAGYPSSGSIDQRWVTDRQKFWAMEAKQQDYQQAKRTLGALQAETYDVMLR